MAQTITIKSGDTLSALAKQYGTTVDALAQVNKIADPNKIKAGASLIIPEISTSGTTTNQYAELQKKASTYPVAKSQALPGAAVAGATTMGTGITPLATKAPATTTTASPTRPTTMPDTSKDISASFGGQTQSATLPVASQQPTQQQIDPVMQQYLDQQKSLMEEYKNLYGVSVGIAKDERDAEIAKLQSDTQYNTELLQQSYDTAQRQINNAMGLIAGSFAIPQAKVQSIVDSQTDLTKNFMTNLAKINADSTYAQTTADLTYQKSVLGQQQDYLNFVSSTMNSMFAYEEKVQNYARERVTTLASTGAIATLDDSALTKLASDSGYSVQDLQAMKQAVSERDDLKAQNILSQMDARVATAEAAEARTALAQSKAASPQNDLVRQSSIDSYINSNRGDDKLIAADTYVEAQKKWVGMGGTLADFKASYPPENLMRNEELGKLPASLRPSKLVSTINLTPDYIKSAMGDSALLAGAQKAGYKLEKYWWGAAGDNSKDIINSYVNDIMSRIGMYRDAGYTDDEILKLIM
jgi:LysM repeat protein